MVFLARRVHHCISNRERQEEENEKSKRVRKKNQKTWRSIKPTPNKS
jgi:hypothetical protein